MTFLRQQERPSAGAAALLGRRPLMRARRAGLTIIELVIASGIIAVLLLASAAAMGENVESATMSRDLGRGAVFLESVQEDLAVLSSPELLAMNGQQVFSRASSNADARFRVEIAVFYASIALLQVELRMIDQVRGHTIASVHTMRAVI